MIQLHAADRDRIHAHLLALDPADRFLRFGAATDADGIARYVAGIAFAGNSVLGVEDEDGALIALGHLALHEDYAELGISVSSGHRQRGIGRALAAAALRVAESTDAAEFRFHFAATNDAMRRLAQQLGMDVSAEGSDLIARRALGAGRHAPGGRAEPTTLVA